MRNLSEGDGKERSKEGGRKGEGSIERRQRHEREREETFSQVQVQWKREQSGGRC